MAVLLSGCAGGLYTDGYNAYIDANGDVVRAYPADFNRTVQAGTEALADVGGTISDRTVEGTETIVTARAVNGSPVKLRFIKEGHNLTVVKVRTGLLGHINQEYSKQLHVFLAANLTRPARPSSGPTEPIEFPSAAAAGAAVDKPAVAAGKTTREKAPETSIGPRPEEPRLPKPAAPTSPDAAPPATRDHSSEAVAQGVDPVQPRPDYVLFFEKDSNIPPKEALAILEQAARRLQDNPDTIITVRGYADSDEDPQDLQLVSESRALAVKSYLIGKGIPSSRIRTAWYGSRLARSASQEQSRQRRVELGLTRGL